MISAAAAAAAQAYPGPRWESGQEARICAINALASEVARCVADGVVDATEAAEEGNAGGPDDKEEVCSIDGSGRFSGVRESNSALASSARFATTPAEGSAKVCPADISKKIEKKKKKK